MNKQETAKILAVIDVMFKAPARSVPVDTALQLDVWTEMLGDLEYRSVDLAVRSMAGTNTWAPSIAEIREAVLELEQGPVRQGAEGWRDFLEAVSRYGSYRVPVFSDPVVARVVASLGWKELCLSENQVADRARFIDLYDRLACDERRLQQSPVLAAAKQQRALTEAQKTLEQVARILKGGPREYE